MTKTRCLTCHRYDHAPDCPRNRFNTEGPWLVLIALLFVAAIIASVIVNGLNAEPAHSAELPPPAVTVGPCIEGVAEVVAVVAGDGYLQGGGIFAAQPPSKAPATWRAHVNVGGAWSFTLSSTSWAPIAKWSGTVDVDCGPAPEPEPAPVPMATTATTDGPVVAVSADPPTITRRGFPGFSCHYSPRRCALITEGDYWPRPMRGAA